jgi:hypothetical protein
MTTMDAMGEVTCPVCSVAQPASDDCIACGHPLGTVEDRPFDADDVAVEGFDEDELDDVPVADDDGTGD